MGTITNLVDINDLMTATELAKAQKVTRKTVYKWLGQGVAPANVTICGTHYFFRSALTQFTPPTRGKKSHGSH